MGQHHSHTVSGCHFDTQTGIDKHGPTVDNTMTCDYPGGTHVDNHLTDNYHVFGNHHGHNIDMHTQISGVEGQGIDIHTTISEGGYPSIVATGEWHF
jgi:hypothetical protein